MEQTSKKEAVILPFQASDNVVSLAEHRARHASPQILTEVVAPEGDRRVHGSEPSAAGLLIRQAMPIDGSSVEHDHKNNAPPDDLIA